MKLLSILLDGAMPAAGQGQGGMSMIVMLVLMFVVFYFFMIRPQQKKQKELNKFRNELKSGDKVMTVGGIHGTVVSILESTIIIAIAQGVEISVEKSCIIADSNDLGQQQR